MLAAFSIALGLLGTVIVCLIGSSLQDPNDNRWEPYHHD